MGEAYWASDVGAPHIGSGGGRPSAYRLVGSGIAYSDNEPSSKVPARMPSFLWCGLSAI